MLLLIVPIALAGVIGGAGAAYGAVTGGLDLALPAVVILTGIIYLISLWVSVAFVRAIRDRYNGKAARKIGDELKMATSMLWPAIWISIITAVVVLAGFVLVIIPGIIFSIWYAFAYYEVVLDGERGWKAMQVSKKLVQGRWWATFWRLLAPGIVFGLLFFIAEAIITFLGNIAAAGAGGAAGTIIAIVIAILVGFLSLLITPLSTAAPTILFLELEKTQKAKK